MANDDFIWTDELTEKVINKLMFSDDEAYVLRTRVRGYSVSYQAQHLNCSDSTVARMISKMKKKYDALHEQYPDDFPARKASKVEKFMDEN